jgi:hypothetical protein
MKRFIVVAAIGFSSLGLAVPAGAHSQTVTPPSSDDPVVSGP